MTPPSPRVQGDGPADTDPLLVLIVDDNETNRKLARDVLRAAGLRALEAGSATEGMALAGEHLPDVILMDLRLPDMDGTDAARALAADERTRGIPVVALSALPLERDGDWVAAAGFAGSLAKPISVDEFPDEVRRYCTR
ncbi:MAG: response regulator [Actinomycetota bacterium]|nr:response regulator [Actinomycetota bacterium]